jgi:hypothetical protein
MLDNKIFQAEKVYNFLIRILNILSYYSIVIVLICGYGYNSIRIISINISRYLYIYFVFINCSNMIPNRKCQKLKPT